MCEKLNRLILNHLNSKNLSKHEILWRVDSSAVDGRGLFANKNIFINEIIFEDYPLLLGPRAKTEVESCCTVCYITEGLKPCGRNCGLPICLDCEISEEHKKICEFILNNLAKGVEKFCGISEELFRSLAPLKALLLPEEHLEVLRNLVGHDEKIHGWELKLIEPFLQLTESQKQIMKMVCLALDSNAFETVVCSKIDKQISLRGLYPLSALANHSCSPNTTHLFNSEKKMIVKASKFIQKDSEIFTTYTTLLWNTQCRRNLLYRTKHFWCLCGRCNDPTEFGTNLNALKCVIRECTGIILPENTINSHSNWICSTCKTNISSKKIGAVLSVLGNLLNSVNLSTPQQLMELIKERLHPVVPMSNQIAVELKLRIVWMLGHGHFQWNGN